MKINEIMITDVIFVHEDTTIEQLLKILVNNKIGGLPVIDETDHLKGMISDGDIIRHLQPKGRTIYDMFSLVIVNEHEDFKNKLKSSIEHRAKNIMKKNIFTVHPDDDIEEVISIFSGYHFKKIPVINEHKQVIGVVSRGDIIRSISTNIIAEITD
ncbi:CBS domain-containing protein [Lentibacillus halophilus]|uniref:CBS domain-containing protein n=1 Tax=Lentibacillus halophilus TaxID=295065 RepID=A0ABP3J7N2_9BACI